jgi:hypothetical protein
MPRWNGKGETKLKEVIHKQFRQRDLYPLAASLIRAQRGIRTKIDQQHFEVFVNEWLVNNLKERISERKRDLQEILIRYLTLKNVPLPEKNRITCKFLQDYLSKHGRPYKGLLYDDLL